MKSVFLSGSRKIARLTEDVRRRLEAMIAQRLDILVGDANGADKAFQAYLADARYERVTVFCSGSTCRNNLGGWQQRHVEAPAHLKGRDFFTVKDKAMADLADYGFVLWDGKSAGSAANVQELARQQKAALVYLDAMKAFETVKSLRDAKLLLTKASVPPQPAGKPSPKKSRPLPRELQATLEV